MHYSRSGNLSRKTSLYVVILLLALGSGRALAGIDWFDTTSADRSSSGWPIQYRDTVDWSHANRSANDLCKLWGYSFGLYVGHQLWDLMGVHCFTLDTIHWKNATLSELRYTNGWGWGDGNSTDVSTQNPMWANHAATMYCMERGNYEAGFFTGHQSGEFVGVNCITAERATLVEVYQNDSRFSFPQHNPYDWQWWELNIAANDACNYHGHRTGVMTYWYAPYLFSPRMLRFRCID